MLSSDKSVESIAKLIELVKRHIELRTEFVKVDVVHKLVRLSAALVTFVIALILIILILFYLSFAFVNWIAPIVGGQGVAYAIVAGIFLILLIIILAKRKDWIEKPLVKIMADILLN